MKSVVRESNMGQLEMYSQGTNRIAYFIVSIVWYLFNNQEASRYHRQPIGPVYIYSMKHKITLALLRFPLDFFWKATRDQINFLLKPLHIISTLRPLSTRSFHYQE